jgi:hypothetical protein
MGKTLKVLMFVVMFILLAMLFGIGYLATRINAVYKPIKEYHLNTDEGNFETRLHNLQKIDTSLKFTIINKRFNRKNFYYFGTIRFEHKAVEYQYDVNYSYNTDIPNKLNLQLMKALDVTHNTGGRKRDKTVDSLTNVFEREIILSLSKHQ